jgi:hypothetical protein
VAEIDKDQFAKAWAAALGTVRGRVPAKAHPIADALQKASFPGAIAVLAGPGREGHVPWTDVLPGLAGQIAQSDEAKGRHLSAAGVEKALGRLFRQHERPGNLEGGVAELVIGKALERQGLAVSEEELREIVALLQSGDFFADLDTSAAAVFGAVPRLPFGLLADLAGSPRLVKALLEGAGRDVLGLPEDLAAVAGGLIAKVTGRKAEPREVTSEVLATFYATQSVGTMRTLLGALLARDNRTVRLALILYARSNGWAVSDGDIDVVYANLIQRENPNLAPVLERAVVVMARRYAPVDVEQALAFLRPRT